MGIKTTLTEVSHLQNLQPGTSYAKRRLFGSRVTGRANRNMERPPFWVKDSTNNLILSIIYRS